MRVIFECEFLGCYRSEKFLDTLDVLYDVGKSIWILIKKTNYITGLGIAGRIY